MSSHILTWDVPDQTRLKSNVYSDGKGAVVAEVEFLVYTHVGMELKWMRLIFSLYSNEREQTRSMMSIYSHGEGAEVGAVEHILTGGGLAYTHILRLSSQMHAEGAEFELSYTHMGWTRPDQAGIKRILRWGGIKQGWCLARIYSHVEGVSQCGC